MYIDCSALMLHDLEPDNGNVTLSISMLYEKLGDDTQAVAYMEEVVGHNPHLTHLRLTLSRIYYSKLAAKDQLVLKVVEVCLTVSVYFMQKCISMLSLRLNCDGS